MKRLDKILSFMIDHYYQQAEYSGMDFGGMEEYQVFKDLQYKTRDLRNKLQDFEFTEQLLIYVQECKINNYPIDIDFNTLTTALIDYYDIQDRTLQETKENMKTSREILKIVEKAEREQKG